ncbi:MAG TPA: hypothetical protein VKV04_02050 [Verrucomicrobiae bacterium]|nr:hypothetical protein [Verrucomicrobiae bacterium]
MRSRSKYLLSIAALIVVLVFAIFAHGNRLATADAVSLKLVGFTNAPNDPSGTVFAMFCVSNCAGYSVRWWGAWSEIEGQPQQLARIGNPGLPQFDGPNHNHTPVLGPGQSFEFAVGSPILAPENGRWRFNLEFSRYALRQRWFDLSFRHRVPVKLGPIVLVDSQRVLSSTNHVIARSEWLTSQ